MDRVLGAVLAGGSSTRMGESKAALSIGTQTFVETVVGTLRGCFDEVVTVGGDSLAPSRVVPDIVDGAGPLGGVATALDHAGGGDVFVAAVDMPLITEETVERLSTPPLLRGQARVARVDGRPQPVCGMYSSDLLPIAIGRLESGKRSMMAFLEEVPHLTLIDITDGSLRNVNTPEEYAVLVEDYGA